MKTVLFPLFFWPAVLFAQNMLRPGDANNDGRVDHLDVLAIGLSFGQEGPPRLPPDQNINWSLKPFIPWPGMLPTTGINNGFSDCDGNGFVDTDDMLALRFNYDSMHMDTEPLPMPYAPPDTFFTSALPRIVFRFLEDTAMVKDTVRLEIRYEHPPNLPPQDAPFGVAFTLEFNESLVKDSLTRVFFEPSANDLLFAAGAAGFADARSVPPGKVEFCVAGKTMFGLAFSRPLGVVQFIVEDVIVRPDTFFIPLKIDVLKPLMINSREQVLRFAIEVDEIILYQIVANRPAPEPFDVRVYPSPTLDWLRMETPETALMQLRVFDAFGQLVSNLELSGRTGIELFTGDWPSGWYWVQLTASDGRLAVRKVLKH